MSKRLTKSSKDKVVDGVCGGIAEYFEVDSTIIRILWALAVFLGGTGVVAYIICMIVIPSEDKFEEEDTKYIEDKEHSEKKENIDPDKNKDLLGLGLIIIGIYFLIDKFLPWMRLNRFWPVILIAVGVYFLSKKD